MIPGGGEVVMGIRQFFGSSTLLNIPYQWILGIGCIICSFVSAFHSWDGTKNSCGMPQFSIIFHSICSWKDWNKAFQEDILSNQSFLPTTQILEWHPVNLTFFYCISPSAGRCFPACDQKILSISRVEPPPNCQPHCSFPHHQPQRICIPSVWCIS